MHVVPAAPDIDPGLVLTDSAIRAAFSTTTWEAGRIYELRGRVRDLRITSQGALIFAETQGTAPDAYLQRVTVGRRADGALAISGLCSCPMGRDCARTELEIVYATLFRRIPTLALAVPAADIQFKNSLVYGLQALPVKW